MKKLVAVLALVFILMSVTFPAFAEGVKISSEYGDRVSLFENIEITEPVSGNVISVLGNISVESRVSGHVIAVFGDIDVNSEVGGQAVTVFGNMRLKSGAKVNGDAITIGSLSADSGAKVLGQEVRILGESMNIDISAIIYLRLAILVLFALAVLLVGLFALAVSGQYYKNISAKLENDFGRKLLLGLLSFMGAGILLLLLLITLVAPLLYILVLVLSAVTASMYFGRFILRTFSRTSGIYMEFITGLVSMTLLKLLLLFLVPQDELLLGLGVIGLLDMFIFSLGLGIHMEERYLNKQKAGG